MKPAQKSILFISGNYYPEPTGIGKYNGEMVELFAKLGFECTVITSYPYYPFWKVQQPYNKCSKRYLKEFRFLPSHLGNPIKIYRCPQYVPGDPTSKKRIVLDFTFLCFAFFKVLQLLFQRKYDYVITVAPSFQIGLCGLFYKKMKGAKFLYHIQDLQIDAARELKMIRSDLLIKSLLKVEKVILNNADIVSSISSGMIKKISGRCKKEIVLFPNWVDVRMFYPLDQKNLLKEEFDFGASDRVVLYSGAIGEKQGLENILDVADALRHLHDLKFVICGSGPYKERLKMMTEKMHLNNVFYLPLQPVEKLNRLLNMADVHLVLQKKDAGDLVMPSKLTTILSVGGLAIVSANPGTNLHTLVSTHEVGIVINPSHQNFLLKAIENVFVNNYEYIKRNARRYAEEFLSVENVFPKFLSRFQ
ncbi:MAG: WcaI family glycosyltransferase [Ilyomonas sp.]